MNNNNNVDIEDYLNNGSINKSVENEDVMLHNGMAMEEQSSKQDISTDELYIQLAEKERDLELAAELGKALLEQNEELKKNHEQVVEEYNTKLEELNEERHRLKLRQTALESEYELTIKELQNDISQLREELQVERSQSQAGNKSQAQIVEHLMLQNDRLTQQLKEAAANEEQLQSQVDTLRHQVNTRKTSIHEHVQQLQMLRDEINLLTERKSEVEKRLLAVSEERDILASQLDDAQDRILLLERTEVENQYTIRQQNKELIELREQNESLQQHVETSVSSVSEADTSLLAELEMSDHVSDQGPNRCGVAEQLKQEILEVYTQLQRLVLQLKGRNNNWQPIETPPKNGLKPGSLLAVLRELRELTEDVVKHEKLQKSQADERDLEILEQQVASLKKELCASQGELERFKADLLQKDKLLEKRNKEMTDLAKQLSLHQEEENRLLAERDRLQDEAAGITRDEIIEQVRAERDKAIERSQKLELELAGVRQDLLCMDEQLLNTIQHKLELSQQLDQWQCDMEDLVSVQVTQKLSEEKGHLSNKASPGTSTPLKNKPRVKFSLPWR